MEGADRSWQVIYRAQQPIPRSGLFTREQYSSSLLLRLLFPHKEQRAGSIYFSWEGSTETLATEHLILITESHQETAAERRKSFLLLNLTGDNLSSAPTPQDFPFKGTWGIFVVVFF